MNHQRATIPAREQGKADNPEKKKLQSCGILRTLPVWDKVEVEAHIQRENTSKYFFTITLHMDTT